MPIATLPSPERARPPAAPAPLSAEQVALFSTDRERLRLAQTLHDSVCQSINGVHLLAQVLTNALHAQHSATAPQAAELCQVLRQAAGELHALVQTLQAPELLHKGLAYALQALVRAAGVRGGCEFRGEEPLPPLPLEISVHVYEVAREAVANALRHAAASKVEVLLSTPKAGALVLMVRDNGCGFEPERRSADSLSGLELARYRAALIGARLAIASQPGAGTTVTCHVSPPHA